MKDLKNEAIKKGINNIKLIIDNIINQCEQLQHQIWIWLDK